MRSSLVHQLAGEGCDKKTISTMASDLMFGGEKVFLISCVPEVPFFARSGQHLARLHLLPTPACNQP